MDPTTIQFYDANASEVCHRYDEGRSVLAAYFAVAFMAGGRVLEIGSGSGRDLHALIQAGFDGRGIDASEGMLEQAKARYPSLAGRLTRDALPNLAIITGAAEFDGVLCSAVLMHLPEELLFDTIFNIRRVLKKGGRLLISTPIQRPGIDPNSHRDGKGRLFNQITPENFQFLFEKVGFRLLNRWNNDDFLGRPEHRWATQLFVLEGHGSGSLDTIESILNRDKKAATYKLALFRALAELATTNYHAAAWLPEGKVAIELELIADKWLEYYWPLFESREFIPQNRGEQRVCEKPVKFRSELERLILMYEGMGGLSGFSLGYRSNNLPAEARALHRRVKSRLSETIRDGPVYYSGGGGSRTFVYDTLSKRVLMEADLWRELSTMGDWIADATILRWAELTTEISQGRLKAGEVVDLLLTVPIPEREVHAARSFYEGLASKVCVWTERSLRDRFDVDHAIPFALWGNNDLWNLLPASCSVNNEKRDRLPTLDLLRARKDCLIHYWSLMRSEHEVRFDFEMSRLGGYKMGRESNWENRLFGIVTEAVEFTAVQRGVERWQPSAVRLATAGPAPARADPADSPPAPVAVIDLFAANPEESDRFVKFVPFFDAVAAAGAFGPEQAAAGDEDYQSWVRVENQHLSHEMFAIRVAGRSMEPRIPDGSVCLFRRGEALAGSREGRIVLVSLRNSVDPETGGRLTVKRYSSTKTFDADGNFAHTRIVLEPLNPDFSPIVLENADEGELTVLAEFVKVISEPQGERGPDLT